MCIIDTTGSVTEAQIIKGVHPLLDHEALRIINGMPHWNPASINGKPIKSIITIPIRFTLEN